MLLVYMMDGTERVYDSIRVAGTDELIADGERIRLIDIREIAVAY